MNIGEVIVNLRKQKGIKQKDLAKSLGITATHLSLIENNVNKPSVTLLSGIANYFDLPVTAIIFKALNSDELENKEQKKYFKAAEPIIDALIQFLLPGDNTAKGKDSLVHIKSKPRKTAA